MFAAYTGLRQGEIAALRIKDVNWLKGTAFVRRTRSNVNGKLDETELKTPAARRAVGIPAFVMDALREYVGEKPAPDSHLFTAEHGGPSDASTTGGGATSARRSCARCRPSSTRLCFHDLRHTHAALLVEQGAHPKEMAERPGHAKVEITLNRYAHVMPTWIGALTARLDGAYGGVAAEKPANVVGLRG